MSGNPSQDFRNRSAYIPPHIEQAMTRQLQQSVPAHLRQYVGENRPAYIPSRVEQSLSSALQKNMPAHLKQYAGAYMQQKIMQPSYRPNSVSQPVNMPAPHPPVPDPLRRGHSMPSAEQHSVELDSLPKAADRLFESEAPIASQPNTGSEYAFIMNPEQNIQPKFKLPRFKASRWIFGLAGLCLLLILFSILKSALTPAPFNSTSMSNVAADQQLLIHLSTNAAQQTDISGANQIFAATASLSLASNQAQLLSYLAKNGHKVSTKQLDTKISSNLDQSLSNAEMGGTFNQVFSNTAQSSLNSYLSDLSQAYAQTKGPKGRALLVSQYKQAKLLLSQLTSS